MEATLLEAIEQGVTESAIELLPDDQVLALCASQLEPRQQEELGEMLDRNREGTLKDADRETLAVPDIFGIVSP